MHIELIILLFPSILSARSQLVGAYGDYHLMNSNEELVYNEAVRKLETGEVDNSIKSSPFIILLNNPNEVKVKFQIVAGTNFVFQIQTGDSATPVVYIKVFQGLLFNPVFDIKSIGTEEPH